MELRRGAAAIATKLFDDANKANEVTIHKEIKAFCSEKNVKLCWSCLSSNCFLKEKLCRDLKMKARFIEGCSGTMLTFGRVHDLVKSLDFKASTTGVTTASVINKKEIKEETLLAPIKSNEPNPIVKNSAKAIENGVNSLIIQSEDKTDSVITILEARIDANAVNIQDIASLQQRKLDKNAENVLTAVEFYGFWKMINPLSVDIKKISFSPHNPEPNNRNNIQSFNNISLPPTSESLSI